MVYFCMISEYVRQHSHVFFFALEFGPNLYFFFCLIRKPSSSVAQYLMLELLEVFHTLRRYYIFLMLTLRDENHTI